MPSKKYQNLINSGKAPFGRNEPSRIPAKSILIVCEGKNTETIYFKLIQEKKAASTVTIETVGKGENDAKNLAAHAVKLKQEREQRAKRRELSPREPAKYDEIWIVFDADCYLENPSNKFHKLTDGLAFAKKEKIKVALSNPCFEFWLLLHLAYTTAPLTTCKDVLDLINGTNGLNRKLNEDDLKNKAIATALMPVFIGKVEQAVVNARRVRKSIKNVPYKYLPTPSTDVDKLICSIVETIPPAHRGTCIESCK